MPERQTMQRAQRDKREGKAPSTQAGEFVREEFHHIREGKHGARSARQAIAIGLSKARRAGVELQPPEEGSASPRTVQKAERDYERGHGAPRRRAATSRRRKASRRALAREGHEAGSSGAIAAQTRSASARRGHASRAQAARKAARTKGPARRSEAARKAARTRADRSGTAAPRSSARSGSRAKSRGTSRGRTSARMGASRSSASRPMHW